MKRQTAILTLENGTQFHGQAFGSIKPSGGELVFNTGMVGYPQALTDPSYRGQILAFTYPLIGNYGVPAQASDEFGLPRDFESRHIHATGVVVGDYAHQYSHHEARGTLDTWLIEENIPAISGIDTRALTKILRIKGSMLGKIEYPDAGTELHDPYTRHLVAEVATAEATTYRGQPHLGDRRNLHVVLVDCGFKASIARSLLQRGVDVTVVPFDDDFAERTFDGLVISNGPGDPQRCDNTIGHLRKALGEDKPILGICLGHQLLALAAGGDTFKMKFGHRSHNQPCIHHDAQFSGKSSRCYITSQNHGFAVHPESLPTGWRASFINANDGTVEGIQHESKPFWGVQFHPEANPGPTDTAWVFDEFVTSLSNIA
jgi:carbamoyl-phosphate synthase small subunit